MTRRITVRAASKRVSTLAGDCAVTTAEMIRITHTASALRRHAVEKEWTILLRHERPFAYSRNAMSGSAIRLLKIRWRARCRYYRGSANDTFYKYGRAQ
jgi:hypothetical protein